MADFAKTWEFATDRLSGCAEEFQRNNDEVSTRFSRLLDNTCLQQIYAITCADDDDCRENVHEDSQCRFYPFMNTGLCTVPCTDDSDCLTGTCISYSTH
jgi:hypothetical protein